MHGFNYLMCFNPLQSSSLVLKLSITGQWDLSSWFLNPRDAQFSLPTGHIQEHSSTSCTFPAQTQNQPLPLEASVPFHGKKNESCYGPYAVTESKSQAVGAEDVPSMNMAVVLQNSESDREPFAPTSSRAVGPRKGCGCSKKKMLLSPKQTVWGPAEGFVSFNPSKKKKMEPMKN